MLQSNARLRPTYHNQSGRSFPLRIGSLPRFRRTAGTMQ
jgi:hypothetical protein